MSFRSVYTVMAHGATMDSIQILTRIGHQYGYYGNASCFWVVTLTTSEDHYCSTLMMLLT
jgi:hypothetical protein